MPTFQTRGGFTKGRLTQTLGTAIVMLIPPRDSKSILHITALYMTTGSTAHDIYIVRPKSKTTVTANAAASQAVINIAKDPGLYSTGTGYNLPDCFGVQTVVNPPTAGYNTADDAIDANDYVAYQCADGTWVLDKVSSVSGLAITMTTNVPTSTVLAGAPFFLFGVATDADPNTNEIGIIFNSTNILSQSAYPFTNPSGDAIMNALHLGDPLMIYDANATAADTIERVHGYHLAV